MSGATEQGFVAKAHASPTDLAQFTNASLLRELERRGYGGVPLGGASNAAIFEELHSRGVADDVPTLEHTFDLDEAAARFRRGAVADALHHLERALPADFAGLAQLVTPRAAA